MKRLLIISLLLLFSVDVFAQDEGIEVACTAEVYRSGTTFSGYAGEMEPNETDNEYWGEVKLNLITYEDSVHVSNDTWLAGFLVKYRNPQNDKFGMLFLTKNNSLNLIGSGMIDISDKEINVVFTPNPDETTLPDFFANSTNDDNGFRENLYSFNVNRTTGKLKFTRTVDRFLSIDGSDGEPLLAVWDTSTYRGTGKCELVKEALF